MQKLIYLIQALEGVPIGYPFHFYHYGPYSSDLAGDLEFVNTLQGVRITYDSYINMYNISVGDKANLLTKKAEDFLEQHKGKIDRIISSFGNKRAEELDLSLVLFILGESLKRMTSMVSALWSSE